MRVHPTRSKSNPASLALLLVVWWLSNNVFAIDAERLFTAFPSPFLFIDLTLCQVLLGASLTQLYLRYESLTSSGRIPLPSPATIPASDTIRSYLPLLIPTLHYFATLLTNVSYSMLGSTTTLLWKLSEPIAAALLNRLILHQSPSATSVLGIALTLFGVYRFSASVFTIPKFSPIILANLLFPFRNVCIKMDQPEFEDRDKMERIPEVENLVTDSQEKSETQAQRFEKMLREALPLAMILSLGKLLLYGTDISALWYMLRNTLLFTSYQAASFMLLERLDALTHSLLNMLKRFTGILLSMLVLHTALTVPHVQGTALTLTGFCIYLVGLKRKKDGPSAIGLAAIAGFVMVGVFFGVIGILNGTWEIRSNVRNGGKQASVSESSRQETGGAYIVKLIHEYRTNRESLVFKSYEDVEAYYSLQNGSNVGNLVWQYGAHEAVPDFKGLPICRAEKTGDCAEEASRKGKNLLVFDPMANTFNPEKAKMFLGITQSIEDYGLTELIVGAGVQIDFREGSNDPELNSSAEITVTSNDFKYPQNTKRFLDALEHTDAELLLRGDFTLNVTRRGGFSRGYSIGCPSFWINQDVHLGRTLERNYNAIAARQGDRSLKIAVAFKRIRGFEKHMIYLRDNYPNARFYAQSNQDVSRLKRMDVPFERVRYFTNVEDWMADLKEMDVAFGARIHGNMIALGAGLPVLVVALDWRILEMVRTMKLPHLTTFDPAFDEDVDVAKLIAKTPRFDGEAFDRNRCKIAKVYVKVFRRYGLGVKRHIQKVSKLC